MRGTEQSKKWMATTDVLRLSGMSKKMQQGGHRTQEEMKRFKKSGKTKEMDTS